MATRIEVLELMDNHRIRVAWYYPVPPQQQLPRAADPARQPAGTRLAAVERTALKEGKLIEAVKVVAFAATAKPPEIARRLEDRWAELQAEALAEYRRLYGLGQLVEHAAWDGSGWSKP